MGLNGTGYWGNLRGVKLTDNQSISSSHCTFRRYNVLESIVCTLLSWVQRLIKVKFASMAQIVH